jgi:predicted DCC family thiol-disulfide oxidoreductase YuxK
VPATAVNPAILLFDGECGFCTRSVLFVFHRDPWGRVRFASLQSEVGARLLRERQLPSDPSTLVLVEDGRAFVRSTAVLRVARNLRWPWSWAYAAIIVPRFIRDAAYGWFAKHRHRFGPAAEACARPSPELRLRMLDL